MVDLKLNKDGDLFLTSNGDISLTDSVLQAVRIRLRWLYDEWRLGPSYGFPYFEQLLVKNPNESKLKSVIRQTVMDVDGVKSVPEVKFNVDKKAREATVSLTFTTSEDTFREEMKLTWLNTA